MPTALPWREGEEIVGLGWTSPGKGSIFLVLLLSSSFLKGETCGFFHSKGLEFNPSHSTEEQSGTQRGVDGKVIDPKSVYSSESPGSATPPAAAMTQAGSADEGGAGGT